MRVCTGLLVGLIALGATAAYGRPKVLQSPRGQGLALLTTGEERRVEGPDGLSIQVPVPQGAVLSAFHELSDGWIAVGWEWTEDGSQLVLLRYGGGAVEELPAPGKPEAGFRSDPVPLVERGELWGVAWLEGDGGEKNAVLAARWLGDEWGLVHTVSPHTGEAQLALTGAVLSDGTGLLAWAAVVGSDDEILWSRWSAVDRDWRLPQRAHADNDVPDIVPRVTATERGALLAWSRYDGVDYRLRVARFEEQLGWLDTGFVGEAGSLYPSLIPAGEGSAFLYKVTSPEEWAVLEIGADGTVARRASTPRVAGEARPLIWLDRPDPLRFPGAGGEAPAAEEPPRALVWSEKP